MTASAPGTIAKRIGAFTETSIDDEIVVMSLEGGDFFSLTGTAAAIWGLIDGQRDRAALITALAAEFAAAPDAIAADVDGFLADLARAGLITAQ